MFKCLINKYALHVLYVATGYQKMFAGFYFSVGLRQIQKPEGSGILIYHSIGFSPFRQVIVVILYEWINQEQ